MKWIKVTLLVLVVLFCLVLAGIVVALKTIKLDSFRPQIISQIKDSTGLDLAIQKLDWDFSVFKGISLDLEGFALKNVLASYVHAHWASNPLIPLGLIKACLRSKER